MNLFLLSCCCIHVSHHIIVCNLYIKRYTIHAMLRCHICSNTNTTSQVTNPVYVVNDTSQNTIIWCISGDAFVSRCRYLGPGQYTTDFSSGLYVPAADISVNSLRLHADEIYENYYLPLDNSNSKIGEADVSFSSLLFTSDLSNSYLESTGNNGEYKNWYFVDNSFQVPMRFSADGTSYILNTHMEESIICVAKNRNDTKCDHIQVSNTSLASFDIEQSGLTSSSADTMNADINYATSFNANMNTSVDMRIQNMHNVIHLNISDIIFSNAIDELIYESGGNLPNDTSSLQSSIQSIMSNSWLCGLRSDLDISFSCRVQLSGIDFAGPSITVTPQLYFHVVS